VQSDRAYSASAFRKQKVQRSRPQAVHGRSEVVGAAASYLNRRTTIHSSQHRECASSWCHAVVTAACYDLLMEEDEDAYSGMILCGRGVDW
jgi:hypothetical protein